MNKLIILLFILYILYLIFESYNNKKYRTSFTHIIHVNGTRGKSSTSRLIDAALRGGDYKVFCKITGTSPRTIDVNGKEEVIKRNGKPNIKEQLKIIKMAAQQEADILVIECMAVNPDLQYVSQQKILNADISVVTNVRRDHLEEMGPSLDDVAVSLGNVMPKDGIFITAEERYIDYYKELGEKNDSKVYLAYIIDDDYGIDFKENISIVLELCKVLGIPKDLAIQRMKNYKRDPGVLAKYEIKTNNGSTVTFINGFAINDPDSIVIIYEKLLLEGIFNDKNFILLVNNRGDRVHRMTQHTELIKYLKPNQTWIVGEYKKMMKKRLTKDGLPEEAVVTMNDGELAKIDSLEKDTVIFAIGNMVGFGEEIIKYVETVGDIIV